MVVNTNPNLISTIELSENVLILIQSGISNYDVSFCQGRQGIICHYQNHGYKNVLQLTCSTILQPLNIEPVVLSIKFYLIL